MSEPVVSGSESSGSIAESGELAGRPLFTPSIGSYGAIRMDPVEMVRHLDAKAVEAAAAIKPKTYLAYLLNDLALPIPEMPWYSFEVDLIGSYLRAVDEERCITSEMCIPIFPNESHPTGQKALRTKPVFPFSNCYHWVETRIDIRVCAREEGFMVDDAVHLPVPEEMELKFTLAKFGGAAARARKARLPPSQPEPVRPEQDPDAVDGVPPSAPSVDGDQPTDTSFADGTPTGDKLSCSSSEVQQGDTAEEAVDAVVHMNVFGNPYEDVEPLPLVHLWIDIPSTLKEDEISNPLDFFKERDAIVRIIQEARARDPTLPTLAEVTGISSDPFGIDEKSASDGASILQCTDNYVGEVGEQGDFNAEPEPAGCLDQRSRRFGTLRMLRTLRTRLRALFVVPYIPVWP